MSVRHDFGFDRPGIGSGEADAPLVAGTDRILTDAVASEALKVDSRRIPEVLESGRSVHRRPYGTCLRHRVGGSLLP